METKKEKTKEKNPIWECLATICVCTIPAGLFALSMAMVCRYVIVVSDPRCSTWGLIYLGAAIGLAILAVIIIDLYEKLYGNTDKKFSDIFYDFFDLDVILKFFTEEDEKGDTIEDTIES